MNSLTGRLDTSYSSDCFQEKAAIATLVGRNRCQLLLYCIVMVLLCSAF